MKSVYGLLAFITVCQLGVFGRDTQGWFNDAVLAEAKEEQYGPARNAAMLATCFLLDGVPMLYNGQEIADAAPLLQKFSPFRGGCLGKTLFGWPSTCPKKRLRSPFLGAIPSHYRQMDLKFVRNEKNYGGAVGREVDTVVAADSIAFLIGPNCLEIVKKSNRVNTA